VRCCLFTHLSVSLSAYSSRDLAGETPTHGLDVSETSIAQCSYEFNAAMCEFSGNAIIISSTSAAIIGLTWGGVEHPWSSPQVLIPLILGLCGVAAFFVYETRVATHPLVSSAYYNCADFHQQPRSLIVCC
jgi:hypothetical protein